jgi:hypothetical protein
MNEMDEKKLLDNFFKLDVLKMKEIFPREKTK